MPSRNLVRSSSSPCHLAILYDLHQAHATSPFCTIFIKPSLHCTIFPSCTIFVKPMLSRHHVRSSHLHDLNPIRSSHPVRLHPSSYHPSIMYNLPTVFDLRPESCYMYILYDPHQHCAIALSCKISPSYETSCQHHAIPPSCTIFPSCKIFQPEPPRHPSMPNSNSSSNNNNNNNKQTNNPQKRLVTLVRQLMKPTLMKTTRILLLLRDGHLLLLRKGEFKQSVLTTVPPPVSRSPARGNICFTKSLPAAHFLLVYTDTYRRSSPIPTFPFVRLSTRSSQRHCQHVHVNTRICRCL